MDESMPTGCHTGGGFASGRIAGVSLRAGQFDVLFPTLPGDFARSEGCHHGPYFAPKYHFREDFSINPRAASV
jgi:hypothetical protein